MSAIGKKLWLHMQEKGPYNQRAFARMLKRKNILSTTHQSISGWLHKEHPAPYFVNAVVAALELTPQEEVDLHYTYFYGERRPTSENIEVARSIEAEVAGEAQESGDGAKDERTSPRR